MTHRHALALTFVLASGCGSKGESAPPLHPTLHPTLHPEGEHKERHAHDETKDHDGHKGNFERRFEDADKWAMRFDDPGRDEWQRPARVVELLAIKPGMVVADIGAGTGYFLKSFSEAVGEQGVVWGLDIEADMVRYMTERAKRESLSNVIARTVKPDDPGLGTAAVERIVIVNTWHHIADRKSYGTKLAAALKRGGTVAVVDYTKEAPFGPPPQHRLSAEEVVAELVASGMRATILTEDLEHQYIVIGSLE